MEILNDWLDFLYVLNLLIEWREEVFIWVMSLLLTSPRTGLGLLQVGDFCVSELLRDPPQPVQPCQIYQAGLLGGQTSRGDHCFISHPPLFVLYQTVSVCNPNVCVCVCLFWGVEVHGIQWQCQGPGSIWESCSTVLLSTPAGRLQVGLFQDDDIYQPLSPWQNPLCVIPDCWQGRATK